MYSNNKQIRDVAAVAAQIMSGQPVTEKLHPNQQKIDVVDDEKIDAKDFAKLRAMKDKVKEEVEQIEELNDVEVDKMYNDLMKTQGKRLLKKHSAEVKKSKDIKSGKALEKHIKKNPGVLKTYSNAVKRDKKMYGEEVDLDNDMAQLFLESSPQEVLSTIQRIRKDVPKDAKEVHQHLDKAEEHFKSGNKAKGLFHAAKFFLAARKHSMKEEVEQIEEMHYEPKAPNAEAIARKKRLDAIRDKQEEKNRGKKSTSNVRKVEGNRYGGAKQKDEMDESVSFTSLLNTYKEGGLKPFLESLSKEEEEQLIDDLSKDVADETMTVIDAGEYTEVTIGEEADTAEFTKTLETNKLKASGRVKQPDLAKGDVMAVKNEEVEQVEEKHMTDAEMDKRETIVKSMKKGLSGFKQRYGDKAKNVMYATATKQAMKEEEESKHYKAGHEYASDHAQDAGFKVTARARKKEMLADNPHKKGTPEHSDWHRGANDGHQTALNNM